MKKSLLLFSLSLLMFNCKDVKKEEDYTFEEHLKIDSIKQEILKKAEMNAYKVENTGWKYDTITNKMSDAKDIFCRVQSAESLSLDSPYDGVNFGTLTVRKMNGKIDVVISIMKGQITGGYENEYFKARFDQGKQITFSYLEPSDNSTETIFVENTTKFLKLLRASKKVLVQIPLYHNGNQILEFNTENLKF